MKGDPDIEFQGAPRGQPRAESSFARKSTFGILLFVICGLAITAILSGETPPPAGSAAYFINGQVISVGRHSLDLAKPIFLQGATPVCGSEDALESFSVSNPGDCTVVDSTARAGLVGIQTDGMRAPSFQMQMQTPKAGWITIACTTDARLDPHEKGRSIKPERPFTFVVRVAY